MKINLDGIFKEIKHIVDAPIERDVKAPSELEFDKILASVSPRREENLNTINNLHPVPEEEKEIFKSQEDIMASYKFEAPELPIPDPSPIQILSKDEKTQSSVKAPALLDARRIEQSATTVINKPEKVSVINDLARKIGKEQGIDPALSMSIISNESSFNSHAVSRDGHFSKGLMQLLDSTGTQYHEQTGLNDKYNPFDPEQNVKLGVTYLRYLHDIFSKPTNLPNEQVTFAAANSSSLEKLAVAAYNAGEGRVASAQARAKQEGNDPTRYEQIQAYLPDSTKQYVENVMQSKDDFGGEPEE
jgi:soluble lytic murein transglycosylase-like protein